MVKKDMGSQYGARVVILVMYKDCSSPSYSFHCIRISERNKADEEPLSSAGICVETIRGGWIS
jgi:hypothetical protein